MNEFNCHHGMMVPKWVVEMWLSTCSCWTPMVGSFLTAETVSLSGRSVISNGTVVTGVVLRPYSTDDC